MRKTLITAATALFVLGIMGGTALADNGDGNGNMEEFPEHPHLLLLHVTIEDNAIVDYERCIDLANNQAFPNHVHHETLHFGPAGAALQDAGHRVIPAEPFWDDGIDRWQNCEELEDVDSIPLPPPDEEQ